MPPILLTGEKITIGRHLDNTIVIASPKASRHHARLERHSRLWYLFDEQHSSGTFLNDRLIPKAANTDGHVQIQPGDVIGIGSVLYQVSVEGDEGAVAAFSEVPPTASAEPLTTASELRTHALSGRPSQAWSLNFGDATTRGDRRTNNDLIVARGNRVALADIAGTDAASEVTYSAIRSALSQGDVLAELSLQDIVKVVNDNVLLASRTNHGRHSMRSTLDLLALDIGPDRVVVEGAHIGDGAVYYVHSGSNAVEALTNAHNPEPGSPVLLNAIGTRGQSSPRPDLWTQPAVLGDRYVMASDGLSAALGDGVLDVLREALAEGPNGAPSPQAVAEKLVRSARDTHRAAERDAPRSRPLDNITVVVVEVAIGDQEPSDPNYQHRPPD